MKIVKFQQGGPAPAPQPAQGAAPAEGAQQDPLMILADMFAQGLETMNCEILAQGAQMFMELLSGAQGGAPVGAESNSQPVFKRGGKMKRKCEDGSKVDFKAKFKVKKGCNGAKMK